MFFHMGNKYSFYIFICARIPVTVEFLVPSVNILRPSRNVLSYGLIQLKIYILYPYDCNYEITMHTFNLH